MIAHKSDWNYLIDTSLNPSTPQELAEWCRHCLDLVPSIKLQGPKVMVTTKCYAFCCRCADHLARLGNPALAAQLRVATAVDALYIGSEEFVARLGEAERWALGQVADSSCAYPSMDFRSVWWFGTPYDFTQNQAACVKVLWEHWEKGRLSVGADALLEAAESSGGRIDVVFRRCPAWGTMIVSGGAKGTYRLAEPEKKKP